MNKDKDKKLKITETVLRDAQQSLIATRMTTADMLPILEKLNDIGYYLSLIHISEPTRH